MGVKNTNTSGSTTTKILVIVLSIIFSPIIGLIIWLCSRKSLTSEDDHTCKVFLIIYFSIWAFLVFITVISVSCTALGLLTWAK